MASPTPGAVKAVDTLVGERVGDHILDELLGVGNAGAVYLARNQKNGYNVAIKVCEKKDPTSEEAVRLAREVEILSSLQHPHIVRLYDAFEDDSYVYIFMELALGGELIDYIAEVVRLEEADARRIFRQIISAIDYAHRSNIVHRDLKLENLLIDSNNNIKLIDFSLANWIDSKSTLSTFCGSPDYAAPELWMFKDYEGKAVDVWSLGVILYATVCGSLPFDTAKDIIAQNYTLPDELSEPCKDLLRKMLEVRVDDRITMENIITHPWVNDGFPALIERKPTWLSQQSAEKAHKAALEKRERANLRARQKRRRQALTGTGPAQSLPTGRKIAEMIAIEDEKRRRAVEAARADKQAALQSRSLESVESTGSSDDAESASPGSSSAALSMSSVSTQMSISTAGSAASASVPLPIGTGTTTTTTTGTTTSTTGMGASGLKLDLTPPTSASLSRHINNEMAEQLKRVPVSNRIRIKVEVPGGVAEQLSVDPQVSMATLKEQICHRHSLRDDVQFVVPSGASVNYASKVFAYLAEGEKLRVRSPGYAFASPPSPDAHSTSDIDDAVSVTSIESLEDEERRLRQGVQASGSMRVGGHVITPQSTGRVVRTYSNRSLLSVESAASVLGPVQEWADSVKWRVVVRMPNDVKLRIPVGTQRTVGYLVEVALRKQNREPKLSKYRVFLDQGKQDVEVPLMDKVEDSLDEGEGIVIMRKEKKRVVLSPDALNLDEVVLVVDAPPSAADKPQHGDGGRGAGGIGVGAPARSRRRRSSNASGGRQVTNRMLLELADRMASPESGVTVDNRVYNSKVFAHTFVGREAVSWLVAEGCAPSRKAAVAMGSLMMERSVFSHVMSGHSFKDKQTSLFRFLGRWAARAIPLVDERSKSVDEERRMRLRMSQLQPHSDLLLPDQ